MAPQYKLPAGHPYKNSPPYAVKFTPEYLDNLELWLNAKDTTTLTFNGNNISNWEDKSGNGNDAVQTNASYQPAYDSTDKTINFFLITSLILSLSNASLITTCS